MKESKGTEKTLVMGVDYSTQKDKNVVTIVELATGNILSQTIDEE
jgi:hypothetical protein